MKTKLKRYEETVRWAKDNGYSEEFMDAQWEDAIKTQRSDNGLVGLIRANGGDWRNLAPWQVSGLIGYADKLRERYQKEDAEKAKKQLAEAERKRQREYYNLHREEILVDKIDRREQLSVQEIEDFLFECGKEVDRKEEDDGRWTKHVCTIKKVNNRYFAVPWEKGLTEMQENEFYEQPYEVEPHEKQIVITEWIKK